MFFLKSFGSTETDQRQYCHDHNYEAYEVNNSAHFSISLFGPHAVYDGLADNNVDEAATFRRSAKI